MAEETKKDNENVDDGKKKEVDELTASDPGHPDYDPLKDPKVRVRTDTLYSAIAKEQEKSKKVQEDIEELRKKIKDQDDKDKSDLEKSQERIKTLESEKNQSDLSLVNEKLAMGKLNAKILTQQAVIDSKITVNKLEMRGLIGEIQDALRTKLETEQDEDVVKRIVGDFAKEKKGDTATDEANDNKNKVKVPPVVKANNEQVEDPDLYKKLKELSKDPVKNEIEIKNILKILDAKQVQQKK